MPKTIICLADGETWDTLGGCSICVISDKDFMDLCDNFVDIKDLTPIVEIGLQEFFNTRKEI